MKGPEYSVIELLDRLVSFDTTSHKSNVALIRFVEDYLLQHGVVSQLVPNADGSKVSLYATIGPENVAGVALSGHTDVVPVVGQQWTSDPFMLTERDGKLYGRGTTDMKGFLACMLAAVPDYVNRKLQVPIHLAFSYDEEIGCLGVRPMIAEFGKRLTMPRMVFVGEPTLMTVVDCHKGPVRWHVTIKGRAAHSSMAPLGVNTITVAGKLLGEIARIEAELKEAPQDARFDPPYATMQVTKITGGTATNIVPVQCTMDFDIRALPGVDIPAIDRRIRAFAADVCLPDMKRVAPEAAIDIAIANQVPPFAAGEHSEAVALALRLAEQNETHAVSYATEAGLFQTGGSPSVVVGPGDIAQAHTADEWIAIEQLEKCSAFLTRLGEWAEHGSAVR
ncbi:acetylornithine deacetylase [Hyphomicrobium sp. D-2]|uniref:acetylornithine deacetylase n=1 Tax=Hyphomicrobium sp. D-2 TaxID=3041621 RepID=UPI0024544149|nr:acetylornithine deacetylase [Hyphomicrobium sp. D-2]MDH4983170.1 acetylornithine deacetylase [Hyphomicrobium sp. D-2]